MMHITSPLLVNKIYKFVRTPQEIHYVSATKPDWLIWYIIFVRTSQETKLIRLRYRAQPVNKICMFVRTSQETHYVFATKPDLLIRSVYLSVPHREHITSLLRAQQVNAIYRFVTMVY
jgi:hypothetical protein